MAVARRYCDALGKIAQLSDGGDGPPQASMLGATLYLPNSWLTLARRTVAAFRWVCARNGEDLGHQPSSNTL